jgi:hypothetical protein
MLSMTPGGDHWNLRTSPSTVWNSGRAVEYRSAGVPKAVVRRIRATAGGVRISFDIKGVFEFEFADPSVAKPTELSSGLPVPGRIRGQAVGRFEGT